LGYARLRGGFVVIPSIIGLHLTFATLPQE
jgi:hypothetical protein